MTRAAPRNQILLQRRSETPSILNPLDPAQDPAYRLLPHNSRIEASTAKT